MPNAAMAILETGEANASCITNSKDTAFTSACYSLHNICLDKKWCIQLKNIAMEILNQPLTKESLSVRNDGDGYTPLMMAFSSKPEDRTIDIEDLGIKIVKTGYSNPGNISEVDKGTALIYACEEGYINCALLLFKKYGEECLPAHTNYRNNSAITYLIPDYIDSDIFRELMKYYVYRHPDDLHFKNDVLPKLCNSEPELKERVIQSLARVPEFRGINVESYCRGKTRRPMFPFGVPVSNEIGDTPTVKARRLPVVRGEPIGAEEPISRSVPEIIEDGISPSRHYVESSEFDPNDETPYRIPKRLPSGGKSRRNKKMSQKRIMRKRSTQKIHKHNLTRKKK